MGNMLSERAVSFTVAIISSVAFWVVLFAFIFMTPPRDILSTLVMGVFELLMIVVFGITAHFTIKDGR